MIIRNIQLRNNFYVIPDKTTGSEDHYTAFGYFDAIVANEPLDLSTDTSPRSIWRYVADSNMKHLDGTTTIRNIMCFTDIDPKEERCFWDESQKHAFLMLTMIRIGAPEKESLPTANTMGLIIYYTSVHSDLVALAWGENYTDCRKKIQKLRNDQGEKLVILKAYSIVSVNDKVKELKLPINDEILNCRLRIAARKKKETEQDFKDVYLPKIAKTFGRKIEDLPLWNMLGSDDYLLELNEVSISDLVPCYVNGGILTHEQYKDFAYNIETEILSDVRRSSQ